MHEENRDTGETSRFTLTVQVAARDLVFRQSELICRELGVRLRIREEAGRAASLCVLDMRGEREAMNTARARIGDFLSKITLVAPPRRSLPRPVVALLSFGVGLLLVGGLFALTM